MSEPMLETRWRIVGLPEFPQRLDIELVVGSTGPAVIEAIEAAAAGQGIMLERIEKKEEP